MSIFSRFRLRTGGPLGFRWVVAAAVLLAAVAAVPSYRTWKGQITTSCTCTKCQSPVLQDDFSSQSVTASLWNMTTSYWSSENGGVIVLNPPQDSVDANFGPKTNPIANSMNWRVEYSVKISDPDWNGYADGVALMFQRGASGTRYYAVEIDTHYNTSNGFTDYSAPHLALNYGTTGGESFIGNHVSHTSVSNVTNGSFHTVRIDYDNGRMAVYFDGSKKIDTTINVAAAQGILWYGYTGAVHQKAVIDNVKVWDFDCPVCGDGTREDPEQCDNGGNNGTACTPAYSSSCTYCSSSCTNVTLQGPRCGDGTRNGSEQCDGSSTPCGSGKMCNSSCQCVATTQSCLSEGQNGVFPWASVTTPLSCCTGLNPTGNVSVIGPGQCGNLGSTFVCTYCGDGQCEWNENECNCSNDCVAQPFCGDGTRNGSEQCDNGAASNGTACTPAYGSTCTYCSSSCTNVTLQGLRCGDGSCTDGEHCGNCVADCVCQGGYFCAVDQCIPDNMIRCDIGDTCLNSATCCYDEVSHVNSCCPNVDSTCCGGNCCPTVGGMFRCENNQCIPVQSFSSSFSSFSSFSFIPPTKYGVTVTGIPAVAYPNRTYTVTISLTNKTSQQKNFALTPSNAVIPEPGAPPLVFNFASNLTYSCYGSNTDYISCGNYPLAPQATKTIQVSATTAANCVAGQTQGQGIFAIQVSDGTLQEPYVLQSVTEYCVAAGCGNGVWETGEGCEDGNTTSGDGCSATCVTECADTDGGNDPLVKGTATHWACFNSPGQPTCGRRPFAETDSCNGSLYTEWYCDAGTRRIKGDGDRQCPAGKTCVGGACVVGASPSSSVSAVCGNGAKEGTEQCDNGASNGQACTPSTGGSCSYCSASCTTVTLQGDSCGDGLVSSGEVCDTQGPPYPGCPAGDTCYQCTNCVRCGNGVIDPGEVCMVIPVCDMPYSCTSGPTFCPADCPASSAASSQSAAAAAVCAIPVGWNPYDIVITPDGAKVYVSVMGDDTVKVLSTASNSVMATISVGDDPAHIAMTPNGQRVYVLNQEGKSVSVIATATNTVIATIQINKTPKRLAITPDGAKVYVTAGNNSVSVISTTSNTVTATVTVGSSPLGIAITPDGTKAYVANEIVGSVSIISTVSDTVIASVSVGGTPQDVAITPNGTKAYVSNHNGNTIAVISTATDTVSASVSIQKFSSRVAITPDGTKVFALNDWEANLSVITTQSNGLSGTMDVGRGPTDIVFTAASTKAYVVNKADDTVSVIATATRNILATIPVGDFPGAIVLSPDGSKAYVANAGGGSITVIDTATNTGCQAASSSSSSSALSSKVPACPDGVLDAGETCEIGVCCGAGYVCDHACRCVPAGSSASAFFASSSSALIQASSSSAFFASSSSALIQASSSSAFFASSSSALIQASSSAFPASFFSTSASSAVSAMCGNGNLEGLEQCETTTACANGAMCMNCSCGAVSFCGDDTVDSLRQEQCEQNADCAAGYVCTTQCLCQQTGGLCGDGSLEGSEECESGYSCTVPGEICSNCLCTPPPHCGHRVLESLEECELSDPCVADQVCVNCICRSPAACGNAVLESGEQCEDDTHCLTGQRCDRSACRCEGTARDYCGDAVLNQGEECEANAPCTDAGKNCDLDTCLCVRQPVILACGDATLDPGEDCDIGIACPAGSYCVFPRCHCVGAVSRCGNGKLEGSERCEIGAGCLLPGEVCDLATCQCAPSDPAGRCSNGLLTAGEECEVGVPCPFGWACDFPRCVCQNQPVCGNSVLDPGEQCETNMACTGDQQTCDFSRCRCTGRIYECGNGVRDPGEEWDDGNRRTGDGCSAVCLRETLYSQVQAGAFCGNGIVENREECDDGNVFSGDGCTAFCTYETLPAIDTTEQHPAASAESSLARSALSSSMISTPAQFTSSVAAASQFWSSSRPAQIPSAPLGAITIPFPKPFSTVAVSQLVRPSLVPFIPAQAPMTRTGPEVVTILSAGAALGWAWLRRRRKE